MIRILLPLLLTASLSGCASLSHPLPKCETTEIGKRKHREPVK
jgi:uncharacterized protein YceK